MCTTCVVYKLSGIKCLALWRHSVHPIYCCPSWDSFHAVRITFYIFHCLNLWIYRGKVLYKLLSQSRHAPHKAG